MVRALQGDLHLMGEAVAGLEVEVLQRGGVALGFEHIGDPFGPLAIRASAGDEEVEFHGWSVGLAADGLSRGFAPAGEPAACKDACPTLARSSASSRSRRW